MSERGEEVCRLAFWLLWRWLDDGGTSTGTEAQACLDGRLCVCIRGGLRRRAIGFAHRTQHLVPLDLQTTGGINTDTDAVTA